MRFADALAQPGLRAIAEVKRRSPSAGDLRPDADPAQLAAQFASAGAAAISVLVDERFAGTIDDLRAARAATDAPLLGKGFFSTEEHAARAARCRRRRGPAHPARSRRRDGGAAARLRAGARDRRARRGARRRRAPARDAARRAGDRRSTRATSRRSRSTARTQLELVARAPRDRLVIAESGVHTRAQGAAAELAGADAILVGSALMQAPDPQAKLRELLSRPLVKVCGLTRQEDVDVAVEAGADLLGFILVEREPAARAERCSTCPRRRSPSPSSSRTPTETPADLVQFYPDDGGDVRGREAMLLRDGREVARVLDQPWQDRDPVHWSTAAAARAASCSRAGSARRTCATRSRRCSRGRSMRRRRSSASRGSRITTGCAPSSRRHVHEHGRLRRLRRPLRPGDADPRARRARARLARGARRRRVPRRAAPPRDDVRGAADAADARRALRARASAST